MKTLIMGITRRTNFYFQHEQYVHLANEREPEVLFVGDRFICNMKLFDVSLSVKGRHGGGG